MMLKRATREAVNTFEECYHLFQIFIIITLNYLNIFKVIDKINENLKLTNIRIFLAMISEEELENLMEEHIFM